MTIVVGFERQRGSTVGTATAGEHGGHSAVQAEEVEVEVEVEGWGRGKGEGEGGGRREGGVIT